MPNRRRARNLTALTTIVVGILAATWVTSAASSSPQANAARGCPNFKATTSNGVKVTVRSITARRVSCSRATHVLTRWIEAPTTQPPEAPVAGYRCSALPNNTELRATCRRGSRRITARYG